MPVWSNEADSFPEEAGEAIATAYLVVLHDTDGKVYLANATSGAGQDVPAIGIAETTQAEGNIVEIKRQGHVSGATALKEGQWIYLATTDGQITQTAPSGIGEIVQVVGIAISTTEWILDFHPHTVVS